MNAAAAPAPGPGGPAVPTDGVPPTDTMLNGFPRPEGRPQPDGAMGPSDGVATPPPPRPSPADRVRHLRFRFRVWRAGLPLRARLVSICAVLLTVGLLLSGLASVTVLRSNLMSRLDVQLQSATNNVVQYLNATQRSDPDNIPLNLVGSTTDVYVYLTDQDGRIIKIWAPQYSQSRARPDLPTEQTLTADGQPYTVGPTSGSTDWRAMSVQLDNGNVATVALSLDEVETTVRQLGVLLLWTGLSVILLGSLLALYSVRRSLRPLRDVETTAAAIADGDLTQRVPELPVTTEVGRVSAALNVMLNQIETSFAAREASERRMRQFVADASHELRTPLASIRGFGELYRIGAVPDAEVPGTMKRIEDEAIRMGDLVEDLLVLARLDERRPMRFDHVDLTVVGGDAVQDAKGLAPDREVRLLPLTANAALTPTTSWGSEAAIRQVVANLLGNAVNHTPHGHPIDILVGVKDCPPWDGTGIRPSSASPAASASADAVPADAPRQCAVIAIRDHGDGIDPAQVEKVFERFYRTDASRARGHGGGSGLGLAIVAAIVEAHRGSIFVTQTPGGGTTFTVQLPMSEADVEFIAARGGRQQ